MRSGRTQIQLAKVMRISGGLVSGFECGTHWPSPDKVKKADEFLRAGGQLADLWYSLANGQAYPNWMSELVEAEKVASRIRAFEPLVVPGLLQTQAYASALVRAANPLVSAQKVADMVTGRLKRQRLWETPEAPQMLTVINESVLLSPTGGTGVMVEQTSRLIEMVECHRTGIQLVPLKTRFHPGSTGTFVLLSFHDRPDALYAEDAFAGRMVHGEGLLEQAQELFGHLQSVAVSLDQSLKRLHEIKRGYEDGTLDVA